MRRPWVITLSAVVALLSAAIVLAYSSASRASGPDVPAGPYQTASQCPDANATLTKLSGPGYDYFITDCPTASELNAIVAEYRPRADVVAACRRTLSLGYGGACEAVVEFAERYESNFGLAPN
jgi:hypothetical protein